MGEYTQKQFLEYYDFKDEPEICPSTFHARRHAYTNLLHHVKNDVATGVKLKDAIRLNACVSRNSVDLWTRAFIKEIDAGKTDTPLIRLFSTGLQSDAKLYREVMGMVMDKAKEGDASTIQYLAKHRLGYNSTKKQEVELSSKEDAPIKFEFVDMTPTDNEETEED